MYCQRLTVCRLYCHLLTMYTTTAASGVYCKQLVAPLRVYMLSSDRCRAQSTLSVCLCATPDVSLTACPPPPPRPPGEPVRRPVRRHHAQHALLPLLLHVQSAGHAGECRSSAVADGREKYARCADVVIEDCIGLLIGTMGEPWMRTRNSLDYVKVPIYKRYASKSCIILRYGH